MVRNHALQAGDSLADINLATPVTLVVNLVGHRSLSYIFRLFSSGEDTDSIARADGLCFKARKGTCLISANLADKVGVYQY